MNSSLQHSVFRILSDWRGDESLKELFWQQLNYDRLNQPLPRHDFPKAADNALAEDPLLFAESSDFHILYCRLASDRLRLTDERAVVNRLLLEHPYALFVFSDASQTNWHFVNVKEGAAATEETAKRRRRLFRRIAVGPYERLRTAAERIAMLDVAKIAPSPLAIQQRHDEAFDVEEVTEAFFKDYQKVFDKLQQELYQQVRDRKWAVVHEVTTERSEHDYALQLLNRIMFLYFIQRKRWIGNDPEFIKTFWEAYKDSDAAHRRSLSASPCDRTEDIFFKTWLNVLFFEAFNNEFQAGRSDHQHFPSDIRKALAQAPYLNGGLFTENKLDNIADTFNVSDDFFEMLFDRFDGETPGFLESYNFTISEDTPFDQEVAVDPVMIGKVYESLVNIRSEGIEEEDRRGTAGIFYTPRIEIDLMCRLALVDYLANHLGEEHKAMLYEAVFAYELDEKQDADEKLTRKNLWTKVDSLLRNVTVLDPACGSGSFLVGMLEVLDDFQERANSQLGIQEDQYNRRKRIIGQSLYGVDVMDFAVHVAELRLWLQLMIETEIHPAQLQFKPLLPNLSFKLRQGDSLVQEIGGLNFTLHRSAIELPSDVKGKITQLKGEKMKFYNSAKYRTEDALEQKELKLFRDILFAKRHAIENRLKSIKGTLDAKQKDIYGEEKQAVSEKDALALENEAQMLNTELAQVKEAREALRDAQVVPFVWDIAFVEIFEGDKKGFDIVVGNPPYVRQELIAPPDQQENAYTTTQWRKTKKEYKDKLRRSVAAAYPNFFDYKLGRKTFRKIDAKSDLYVYFYLHGLSLLSPKGSFCFITSNSWLDVGYGKDLQEFLLKHSHVKIILDNQAKRSFAADVNTIIALLSPPDLSACNAQAGDKQQGGFDETARFVMFKVPFEDILSPVIFQEIEEATERMSRREFRVCTLRQRELYEEGLPTSDEEGRKRTTTARYEGNKWGGKYLRAPDIFFRILEKGKGKLVRLDDIAEVRRGFTTGANEFFYLDEEKIAEWGIEEEFLKPVIKSPRECKSIIVNPADLKFKIFVCHEEKQELKGANALDYIEWGEMRGFHERPSCRSRARWYDLGEWQYPDMLWSDAYNVRFGCFENVGDYFGDKRFFLINFNEENGVTRAYLNSTIISLFIETEGITNLGEGVIYTNVYWLKKLPVLNEESYAGREIHQCYDQIKTRAILPIFEEVKMEDRHKLDSLILDLLGLDEDDQKLLYEGVVQLVQNRITKADSV